MPGLELEFPVTPRWRLLPFGEAGVARDRTSDFDERVFAVGLRSRFALGGEQPEWTLFNELVRAGVDLEQTDDTDEFTRFRTGLTVRRAIGRPIRGYQPDVLGYALQSGTSTRRSDP